MQITMGKSYETHEDQRFKECWVLKKLYFSSNNCIFTFSKSSMFLHCRSKEDENILLTSVINCNNRGRKNNELSILYPKTIKNNKSVSYPNTVIILKCEI